MPTEEEVLEVLAQECGVSKDIIEPQFTLDQIGADSSAVLQLPLDLEETFDLVHVDGENWNPKKTTVADVLAAVMAAKPVPKLEPDEVPGTA